MPNRPTPPALDAGTAAQAGTGPSRSVSHRRECYRMSSPPSSRPSAHGRPERPIGAFADAGLQALAPFCRQLRIQGLCPSARSILARLRPSPTHRFGGGPVRSPPPPRSRIDPPAAPRPPRQATTPGSPPLRAFTRVPSGATGPRRVAPTTPAGPSGSTFVLESGSCPLLGISGGLTIEFLPIQLQPVLD